MIDLCANLAGIENKAYPKREGGLNGFDVFRFARTMCE
jgi:hypothetical protein